MRTEIIIISINIEYIYIKKYEYQIFDISIYNK